MELTQEQQNMLDAHNKGTCSSVQSGRGFVVRGETAECGCILQSLTDSEPGVLYFILSGAEYGVRGGC